MNTESLEGKIEKEAAILTHHHQEPDDAEPRGPHISAQTDPYHVEQCEELDAESVSYACVNIILLWLYHCLRWLCFYMSLFTVS